MMKSESVEVAIDCRGSLSTPSCQHTHTLLGRTQDSEPASNEDRGVRTLNWVSPLNRPHRVGSAVDRWLLLLGEFVDGAADAGEAVGIVVVADE